MSTTTLSFANLVGGIATNATSITLAVWRTDNGQNVVPALTVPTTTGTGAYSYTLADPAYGLTYKVVWTPVNGGVTYNVTEDAPGTIEPPLPGVSYLTVTAAGQVRANLPPMSAWDAANSGAQAAALVQATSDIDNAMRYQGKRHRHDQPLQFPRLAYASNGFPGYGYGYAGEWGQSTPRTVWDWDEANQTAVVPADVLAATLWQANWILGGWGVERLDEQHQGVKSQQAAGVGESYGESHGARTGLCRRAWHLLKKYELVSGQLL